MLETIKRYLKIFKFNGYLDVQVLCVYPHDNLFPFDYVIPQTFAKLRDTKERMWTIRVYGNPIKLYKTLQEWGGSDEVKITSRASIGFESKMYPEAYIDIPFDGEDDGVWE